MKFYVFSQDLKTRHQVAAPLSVQWEIQYNDIGKCSIEVPATEENINELKKHYILYSPEINEHGRAAVIEQISINDDGSTLSVCGYTANYLLSYRVLTDKINVYNVEAAAYKMVEDNLRGMNLVCASSKGYSDIYDTERITKSVSKQVISLLEQVEMGHCVKLDTTNLKWVFEVFKGEDKTRAASESNLVLMPENGRLKSLKFTDDDSEFYNAAYVTGEIVGASTVNVWTSLTTSMPQGDKRYELYVDADDISYEKDAGSNLEAYKKLLVQRGNEKLREQLPNITITSQLETSEFFEHWNIGDKVTCKSNKYGIQYDVRITGLKYTIDKNNYTVEVLFGAPLIIKKEGD